MAYLLRKLNNKRYWDKSPHEDEAWLVDEFARADALKNLLTTNNSLSMYRVDDPVSQVDRVLAALASTTHLKNVDYAYLDESEVVNIGVKLHAVPGETPDEFVNTLHVNLVELTSERLSDLAKLSIKISTSKRLYVKKVKKLIKGNINNGYIDKDKVFEGVLEAVMNVE